ncbi:MAG: acetyl-CoA carboxylase biotin carboxyl carrier protein [Candidatus Eremiobacteraeota bacterium]|nr:acetyl-CoA carboxylase biotin carboxyl carrier protein [Candidatus Eremiobacteraeota bacterium]
MMEDRYAEETRTLRELLDLMHEHDLETLKIKLGDTVYELSRRDPNAQSAPGHYSPPGPAAEDAPLAAPANVTKVLAPLTGVFYRSASPDSRPYVEVGDRVESGDVLCVLEAMKLFNEIQSDDSGTILRVVPDNGELVSQGDELFWIER